MTVKLTKKAALTVFKEEMALAKSASGGWNYGEKDSIAKREAWNVYTDSLCKDGIITEHQYNTWANPF